MDVEKTMEFLLDRAAHHDQQIAELTADVAELARATRMLIDDRQFLSGKVAEVIEIQKTLSDQQRTLSDQQRTLTDQQRVITERQSQFAIERNEDRKYYDRRFDQMVSAIGEFIQQTKSEPPIN